MTFRKVMGVDNLNFPSGRGGKDRLVTVFVDMTLGRPCNQLLVKLLGWQHKCYFHLIWPSLTIMTNLYPSNDHNQLITMKNN